MNGATDGGTGGAPSAPREPTRTRPDERLSARFAKQARDATKPEMQLRRELHRLGFRYRVQYRVPGLPRRRVDIAFSRARLAVFVDGCFWHSCPDHCVIPRSNRDWWLWKFEVNKKRDADTDARLRELGWQIVRIWEHESLSAAVHKVETALGSDRPSDYRAERSTNEQGRQFPS